MNSFSQCKISLKGDRWKRISPFPSFIVFSNKVVFSLQQINQTERIFPPQTGIQKLKKRKHWSILIFISNMLLHEIWILIYNWQQLYKLYEENNIIKWKIYWLPIREYSPVFYKILCETTLIIQHSLHWFTETHTPPSPWKTLRKSLRLYSWKSNYRRVL